MPNRTIKEIRKSNQKQIEMIKSKTFLIEYYKEELETRIRLNETRKKRYLKID